MDIQHIEQLAGSLRDQIGRTIVGQAETVDMLLVALFARGHILLEGPPGTAKTLLARCFAASLSMQFKRIQFTPDLMPSDVMGANIFNFKTNEFTLTRGPVFTDFLLADEINRTPPKTQSALLEAMQERAVTLDGKTIPLPGGFMVVATQNPIEQEGTYPLPEAQLDRFLMKVIVSWPSRDEERRIVRTHGAPSEAAVAITAVADLEALEVARRAVDVLEMSDAVVDYTVDLIRATREHPALHHGASPRAAANLAHASRALAAIRGRAFVIPDDVKDLFIPTMRHRVVLAPEAEIEGQAVERVLAAITQRVAAPR